VPANFTDKLLRSAVWIIVAVWLLWFAGVILHGLGANLWADAPDFETSGQFGDSFGPLASLMAALAAAGAFLTVRQQRELADEQRSDFAKAQERAQVQDFEQSYFRLLGVLIEKTHRIDLTTTKTINNQVVQRTRYGPDAFKIFVNSIRGQIVEFDADEQIGNYYIDEFREREADLGHYFRLVYHVLLLADTSPSLTTQEQRYEYARILRAQLSNPELLMILMNCTFGHGEEKFLPLAVKYDLFQNLADSQDSLSIRMLKYLDKRLGPPLPTSEDLDI